MYRKVPTSPAWLAAILLFSFLPTLSFLGHWDEIFRAATVGSALIDTSTPVIYDLVTQQTDLTRHAMHCHTSSGSCSEQPMPAGVGLFVTHEALLGPPPSASRVRVEDAVFLAPDPALTPLIPPPRSGAGPVSVPAWTYWIHDFPNGGSNVKTHSWFIMTMTSALILAVSLLLPAAGFAGMGPSGGMGMGSGTASSMGQITLTQATPSYSVELDIDSAMLMLTPDQAQGATSGMVMVSMPNMGMATASMSMLVATTDDGQPVNHHLGVHIHDSATGVWSTRQCRRSRSRIGRPVRLVRSMT